MINEQQAKRLAITFIGKKRSFCGPVVIDEQGTLKRPYGWIFFYNTQKYIETQNPIYGLVGNGPLVVENSDGTIHQLGTAYNLSEEIIRFEMRRFGRTFELPDKLKGEESAWD